MDRDFWNQRYAEHERVYGDAPNGFLASQASHLPRTGHAIDLGAGEGRNALFLASLGLEVLAVDQSEIGLRKAAAVAMARGLSLRTEAVDLNDFDAPPGSFDVVSSIFVHLPAPLRQRVHSRLIDWLRPDGVLVFEAYAPDQLSRTTGGPKDPIRLAPLEDILSELDGLVIEHAEGLVREVSEGLFHTGEASVVQVRARKP